MGNNKKKNTTNLEYSGTVKFKLRLKDRIIEFKKHNAGTETLSKAFAQFISGKVDAYQYRPAYIDLQSKNPQATDPKWSTFLKRNITLSSPEIIYDTNDNNWFAVFTAAIPYALLINEITPTSSDIFRLALLCDIGVVDANMDRALAYLTDDGSSGGLKDTLCNLEQGTQLIIEWRLELLHGNDLPE